MAIPAGKVLVQSANSDITASDHVERGDANAVIVELNPTGTNPVAQIQVLDSATPTSGYRPTVDPNGTQSGLTPSTPNKYLVVNVLPYVKIRVMPTSGQWSATVTPVLAVPSLSETGANALEVQGAGAAGSMPAGNPILLGGSDGTNTRVLATDAGGHLVFAQAEDVLFNALGVTDTANHTSTVAGTRGYKTKTILVNSSLNQTMAAIVEVSQDGVTWNQLHSATISLGPGTLLSILQENATGTSAGGQSFVPGMNGAFPFLRLRFSCSVAPTIGAVSAWLEKMAV